MAVTVFCPKCETKLRVPETAQGKKVRCRACGKVFPVEPSEDENEDEEVEAAEKPRPRRRRRDQDDQEETVRRRSRARAADDEEDEDEDEDEAEERQGPKKPLREQIRPRIWLRIASGLQFLGMGITLFLLSFCLFALAGIIVVNAGSQPQTGTGVINAAMGAMALTCMGFFMQAIGFGSAVTGKVLCLWAPPFYGAKYLAVASLCLIVLSLFTYYGGAALGLIVPLAGPALAIFGQMLLFGSAVTFLFFLRAITLVLLKGGLARSTMILLAFGIFILTLSIILYTVYLLMVFGVVTLLPELMTTGVATGLGLVFLIMVGVSMVFYLIWIIWYIALIFQVKGAVNDHVGVAT